MARSWLFAALMLAAAPAGARPFGAAYGRAYAFAARAQAAFKASRPPLSAVRETQSFPTAQDAAVAALRLAIPMSRTYEHGGFILELGGSFYYSDPVSNHGPAAIAFRAGIPKGGRMAAIYHTHPSDEQDAKLFSAHDVVVARQLGIPSYIGVWGDGTVRLFDARKMRTRRYSDDFALGQDVIADGVIVARLGR